MKFIHRLGYFMGGFAVGLVILAVFLNGKRTSCAYFPDARVMRDIDADGFFALLTERLGRL